MHGTVAARSIIANRHIKVSPQCPLCPDGAEDIRHLIFTCHRAKEVWSALGLTEIIDEALMVDRSGSVVMEEIIRSNSKERPVLSNFGVAESVIVGAWYIWWQRREFVKGNSIAPPTRTAFSINAITSNYAAVEGAVQLKKIPWQT